MRYNIYALQFCSLFPRSRQSRTSTTMVNLNRSKVSSSKEGSYDYPSGDATGYQGLYVTSPPSMSSAPTTSTGNREAGGNVVTGGASTDVEHDYNYPDVHNFSTSVSKNKKHNHDTALYHTYHSQNTLETDATDAEGYLAPFRKTSPANSHGNSGDYHFYNYPDPLVGLKRKQSGRGPDTPSLSNANYIEVHEASVPRNGASSLEHPSGSMPVYQTRIHRM